MQWVASTLHTTLEHGVSSITAADADTSASSSRLKLTPRADLNGLVRFAERRNLVSARVPSHFKRGLHCVLPNSTGVARLHLRKIVDPFLFVTKPFRNIAYVSLYL